MRMRVLTLSGVAMALGAFAVAAGVGLAQSPPAALPPAADAPGADPAAQAPQPPPSLPAETATPPVPATPPAPATPVPVADEPAPAAAAPVAPAPVTPPTASTPTAQPPVTPTPAETTVTLPVLPPERPPITQKSLETTEPAKVLFSQKELPSIGKAMAIGYYPKGCLQGGVALPVTGPSWQVMRLSRNRNWGHPELVQFLERFAPLAAKATGWHGILVGDMAQPRGGPLPFGHKSHQVGLDVDIWFLPMPDHVLSKDEREKTSAINLVAADWKHVNPRTWSKADVTFIRTAAEQPEVERVLVNAAIKKQICREQGDHHPSWMDKVRPWYGHHDHIHVRLKCPADSPHCRRQDPVPDGPGCGKELDYWFSDRVLHPKREPGAKKRPPPRPLMLADLPPACKAVLEAPAKKVHESKVN